jgi:CxxC motif-containing protein (DUF1111 family)
MNLSSLWLQFGRVANIFKRGRTPVRPICNVRRSIDQEESARDYCGELFGSRLMIRPVVASVVFDAALTPTAGSFQRNYASRDHRRRDHIMKRLCGALCWIVLLVVVVPVGYRATGWLLRYDWQPKSDALASEVGRDLFLHEWTPGDPLAAQGDGLGPVFNASSCAACHQQGGVGGSGSLEHNVTVFTRAPKAGAAATRGVIHQFATDAASQETLQNIASQFPKKSRPTLTDLEALLPKPAKPAAGVQTVRANTAPEFDIGQRNTTSLFGAGLVDAIPDAAILGNERNQRTMLGMVILKGEQLPSGRAAKLPRKRIGKFGWKANVGSLSEFVRVACANELGLGNPLQAQPASLSQPGYRPRGLDLTDQQCDQMTAFIAALPRPQEVIPSSAAEAARALAGKKHFKQIGCTNCHTADVAEVQGIYSDLLVHEMGEGLGGGGFYGAELPDSSEPPDFDDRMTSTSEWRTPPLWGVADSAPYLHDGRAATLAEAIKLHAGQASSSANRFTGLSDVQQEELIAFLNTLRAPSVLRDRPEMVTAQTSNRSAAHATFGNFFKLNIARLDAGSFPVASNSSDLNR